MDQEFLERCFSTHKKLVSLATLRKSITARQPINTKRNIEQNSKFSPILQREVEPVIQSNYTHAFIIFYRSDAVFFLYFICFC